MEYNFFSHYAISRIHCPQHIDKTVYIPMHTYMCIVLDCCYVTDRLCCLYAVQLATVRNQLLEVQGEYDKIKNELRETKLSSDALVCQKEKELETLKADVAKYQVGYLHAC